MDIFGFANQGINYDKFRPRYQLSLIQNSIKLVKGRNRYLDIATGTGQLLFMIAPYFKQSFGIDISPNMISTARKQLEQSKQQDIIKLQVTDFMKWDSNDKHGKFDFITIGQALHFMPIREALQSVKGILTPNGRFETWGYVIKEILSENEKQNQHFNEFYSKVKPLFTFDRDDLHTFYSQSTKYPFEEVFKSVQREVIEQPLQLTKLQYLSYLKTMSGYNLYLQKNGVDPIEPLQKACADNVTCMLYYFRISCQNQ